MQAVLNGELRIPAWTRTLVNLVAIASSAAMAALVFQVDQPGSLLAVCFALPFALVMLDWVTTPRSPLAHLLPVMTGLSLLGMALEPGFLNVSLTWILLAAMAVAARGTPAILAMPVMVAIARLLASMPQLLFRDSRTSLRMVHANVQHVPRPALSSIILPFTAVAVFTLLLATANPLIEQLLLTLRFDQPWQMFTTIAVQIFSWGGFVFVATALLLWPILRGQTSVRESTEALEGPAPLWHQLFFKPAAVVVTLLLLNLLFAAENALDIWHVWMKSALPEGMTHAAYVHRGSYTLIATAILAGLLMVFALWKGTATEQSPHVRLLVYLWTAQNLLLVASSAKRTLDYIDAYGWTEWRLAGLLWMVLVFFGLASIIWRVAGNFDSRWLVNANLVAACVLLVFCAVVDQRGFIARKNLEAALNNPGRYIDLNYLRSLGSGSIEPKLQFEKSRMRAIESSSRPITGGQDLLDARLALSVANTLKWEHDRAQQDWRSWTWRYAHMVPFRP